MVALLLAFTVVSANSEVGVPVTSTQLVRVLERRQVLRARCGPLSAWYCLRKSGRDLNQETVLAAASVGTRGMSLYDLLSLVGSYGVHAEAIRVVNKNVELLPAPAILVFSQQHCVAYDGIDAETGEIRVFEPSECRVLRLPPKLLDALWSGEAIVFAEPRLPPRSFIALTTLVSGVVFGLGTVMIRLVAIVGARGS